MRTAIVVALMGVLGCPGVVQAAEDPPDPGQTTRGTVTSNGNVYSYIRYVPRSLPQGRRAPLLVMVHGAQTTAEQELHATGFNRVAEREGFVVLYPDVDAVGRSAPGPLNQSWEFYDPSTYFRGNGDSAAIADMTRDTMAHAPIDPERVYVVGVSAGGLMEAVEAAAYSDLFAAAVSVESAGYADGFCFTDGVGIPVEASAQLAFAQMGPRARVVPTMVITSDGDLAFPYTCGEKALQQGLRMNNLVLSGSQDAPLKLTPASVRHDQVPGGYGYDVSSYRDPDGCLVAEQWLIHGMPHSWPGGPTVDPKYTGYTDRKAPSGAEAAWAFVRRYAKSQTSLPCAEASVPSALHVTSAGSVTGPCTRLGRLTFILHRTRYGAIKRVEVFVGKRLALSRHGRKLTSVTIDLRGNRRAVRILAYDSHGLARNSVRVVGTCTKSAPTTKSRHRKRKR